MKTVKTIFRTIALLTIISLTSCSTDDDATSSGVSGNNNGTTGTERSNDFSIANATYSSPKAYLVISGNGTGYESEYQFIFADADIRLDANNDLTVQTDSEAIVAIKTGDETNIVASIQDVLDQITVSTNVLENGIAFDNITSWGATYMYNSEEFGTPNAADIYELDDAIISSLEIESVTFDLAAGTGTINCAYSYTSATNSVVITGEYAGSFEIIDNN